MSQSAQKILAPLEGFWDRIIRRPMSNEEIADLERQVGLKAPVPLRDYLSIVGLFQDLTIGKASPFEVYDSPAEIASARKFLCQLLPADKQGLFPFGTDGAGNVFCLPTGSDTACQFQFVDHETRKISRKKAFEAWLQDVVEKVLKGIKKRVPNEHKVWAVQFSFRDLSYDELKKVLGSVGRFRELDREWKNLDDDDDVEVKSAERQIELNGAVLKLGRLECEDWNSPMFSIDLRESLAKGLEQSQIRQLNSQFQEKCPGYRLVDYGPLDGRNLAPPS